MLILASASPRRRELMEKLQTAYPHLKDNPPTFDDGENPILNM